MMLLEQNKIFHLYDEQCRYLQNISGNPKTTKTTTVTSNVPSHNNRPNNNDNSCIFKALFALGYKALLLLPVLSRATVIKGS